MNAYDVNSNEHILAPLLEKALLDIMIETDRRCMSEPQEPEYVAMLSTEFTKRFFYILTAVFPDYNFSVTGVYCHQKPIVDINLGRKHYIKNGLSLHTIEQGI